MVPPYRGVYVRPYTAPRPAGPPSMSSPGQMRPAVEDETAGPPSMSSPGQVRPAVEDETAGPPSMSSPGQVRPAGKIKSAARKNSGNRAYKNVELDTRRVDAMI